jgi:4-hydroxy-2-oxoheptanedioate aldolase
MQTPPHRFKLGLSQAGARIGLCLAPAAGYAAEICAGAGYDWVQN